MQNFGGKQRDWGIFGKDSLLCMQMIVNPSDQNE